MTDQFIISTLHEIWSVLADITTCKIETNPFLFVDFKKHTANKESQQSRQTQGARSRKRLGKSVCVQ